MLPNRSHSTYTAVGLHLKNEMSNKNLILIPGAWSDKSIWDRLKNELSKFGIKSHTITLDGLQRNEQSKDIGLQTHVDNIVSYLNSIATDQFFLVGHSYSGFVASLAAQQVPEKVAGLIFIEAFLPENGKSLLEMAGLDAEEETRGIEKNNGTWPPPTKEEISSQPFLTDKQVAYLVSNMTGHPGKTVTDKSKMTGDSLKKLSTSYIGGNLSDKIKHNPNFENISFFKLDGGHWPMLTKPRELAEIIKKI